MSTPSARRSAAALLLLIAALLLAAGCGGDDASGDGGSGDSGDSCGATEIDGLKVVRHCGDASGEITREGTTMKVDAGSCELTDDAIIVNLGTSIVDPDASSAGRPKHPYIGILGGKHPAAFSEAPATSADGTYSEGITISADIDGEMTAASGDTVELTLTDDRSKGTFTATDLTGEDISGSFSCG